MKYEYLLDSHNTGGYPRVGAGRLLGAILDHMIEIDPRWRPFAADIAERVFQVREWGAAPELIGQFQDEMADSFLEWVAALAKDSRKGLVWFDGRIERVAYPPARETILRQVREQVAKALKPTI